MRIIERFALDICGCERMWTAASIIQDAIAKVQERVGKDQVLLGLSEEWIPQWWPRCCNGLLATS